MRTMRKPRSGGSLAACAVAAAVSVAAPASVAAPVSVAAPASVAAGPAAPGSPGPPSARAAAVHDIPADVTVRMFVAPRGQVLRVVVRAPLEAMRDIEFPVFGPGYLDLAAAGPLLRDAAELWVAGYLAFFEDGRRLARPAVVSVRPSLPSDRSFADLGAALAHVAGPPLSPGIELPWQQALLDVLLEVPIRSARARFAVESDLAHLGVRTLTVLRFVPVEGGERLFQFTGTPGRIELDPSWASAIGRFVRLGFLHILGGLDHLLFLLALVIPLRRVRSLLPVVTAFTVAHSITLIASASGLAPGGLWFPPLVETLVALSIVFMAVENVFGVGGDRRWALAFAFGLVHGFGFSFALRESLQFAGSHVLASLFSFNLGVEIGQVFVLAIAVPILVALFRRLPSERAGVIVLSAFVAHTGWHWMTARGSVLLQYDFAWPAPDAALAAALMRWAALVLIAGGAAWGLRRPLRHRTVDGSHGPAAVGALDDTP